MAENQVDVGFLLTRQARDKGQRTEIELWVSTDNGPVQLLVTDQEPVCFIATESLPKAQSLAMQHGLNTRFNSLSLKNFQHQAMTACYNVTISQHKRWLEVLAQADITSYEDDIRLADRFLMERFIQGSMAFVGHNYTLPRYRRVQQAKVRPVEYQPKLTMVSLDIECSQKGILYSVGLYSELDKRVIMVGEPSSSARSTNSRDDKNDAIDHRDDNNPPLSDASSTPIQWVTNEKALLIALTEWFDRFDPDVIIGWNVIDFDFRLLFQRAQYHHLAFAIGRGGQKGHYRQSQQNKGYLTLPGRVVLDGIDTLKTATYHFSSWSLENVAQQLLGEGKAIDDPHDRMAHINHMFAHDKPALAFYNLKDCQLVERIFKHTHMLEFAIERSKLTGVELDRVGGSVAAFTNLYLPRLHRQGYVAPNLMPENWQASPGGYVMDSKPGLYDSVIVLDFKSLYPSIIRSFLIDPMGLIEGLEQPIGTDDHQSVPGFRGGQFHRQHHFLPALIETLWSARDRAKKAQEWAFSQAIKIIMNSFYGVLGSSGCRFFDTRLASSITMRGHEIMKQTRQLIEQQGYEVIYGDTDSTFVSLGKLSDPQQADQIGNALAAKINTWWQSHLKSQYRLESALEIEYETHYLKFLMPTIRGQETGSKKRYAGLVVKNGKEEIIFKGLESARTDWTPLSHEFQAELYQRVFHGQDPSQWIREFVEQTQSGQWDHKLVYRKQLRRALKEYQKNVPPQVRAARLADEKNRQLGRPLQYQKRSYIEYYITVNGPEPKSYLTSPIDYQHYIDKQLKPVADAILPYINLQFDQLAIPQLGLF
ncbi:MULTISPECIES: DNA polymerase II [unclassified Vibrio]|uniref:DNA polymerase n=1 Tax=Vibrio sp. HB236076 TaxID=3232307 RepID=A0AB39H7V5_9VIBR|nr:DNA polymerase II [Vibrio sp. HB161653]MDP5253537.1 DNA polymerase II [Vibrio sp. HB161653]